MKRESQSDRILAVLRMAAPHDRWLRTADILAGAGYCSFSARISELRSRGYRIDSRRIEGAQPGPESFEYRLISGPLDKPGVLGSLLEGDRSADAPGLSSCPVNPVATASAGPCASRDGAAGPSQLTLTEAA